MKHLPLLISTEKETLRKYFGQKSEYSSLPPIYMFVYMFDVLVFWGSVIDESFEHSSVPLLQNLGALF